MLNPNRLLLAILVSASGGTEAFAESSKRVSREDVQALVKSARAKIHSSEKDGSMNKDPGALDATNANGTSYASAKRLKRSPASRIDDSYFNQAWNNSGKTKWEKVDEFKGTGGGKALSVGEGRGDHDGKDGK